MIESTLITYLSEKTNVSVGVTIPKNKTEYIVIQRINGGRVNQIKKATFSFACYAGTDQAAADLCEKVEDAIFDIIALDSISGVSLGDDSRATDTSIKAYAYECIFNFSYY